MNCPYPQPLALRERARVRADLALHTQIQQRRVTFLLEMAKVEVRGWFKSLDLCSLGEV
jgi:hypothetical protein